VPSKLTSYGYRLVLDSEWNDTNDINFDNGATPSPSGYKFFTRLFSIWGGSANSIGKSNVSVANGVLTITGGQISTIAPGANASGYVGTTFQGGAYFEARMSWSANTPSSKPWWPSFYSVPTEYFVGTSWPGQASSYKHFVENDFFEAWGGNQYGATIHDWYGALGCTTTALDFCDISNDGSDSANPSDPAKDGVARYQNKVTMPTGAGIFHVIGALWVSARQSPNHIGYVEYFVDGQPTGVWKAWMTPPNGESPPPTLPYIFSGLDDDHSTVFIGGPSNWPVQVDWIHVWQLNNAQSNPVASPEPGFSGP
jgi:hypothetical protein